MKWLWPTVVAAWAAALNLNSSRPVDEQWTVIIGGDLQGYLTPCGCTKPMLGGVARRASLVLELRENRKTVVLETSVASGGGNRQNVLKLEALSEVWKLMKVDAVALSSAEHGLGEAQIAQLQRLAGDVFVDSQLPDSEAGLWQARRELESFVIGTYDVSRPEVSLTAVLRALQLETKPVLLLTTGDKAFAESVAQQAPWLKLVTHRSKSQAPKEPTKVGDTWVVSAGEKGKAILKLDWRGGWAGYTAYNLGPETHDHAETKQVLSSYLERVKQEKLIEQMPRVETPQFAGNKMCGSCHAKAYDVWKDSQHAEALKTLEDDGHDFDPECIGCHVVGIESTNGFKSRADTKELTDVGCESCHGPGLSHAMNPAGNKVPKVGAASCAKCHVIDHSPEFTWDKYWPKIAH